MGTHGGGGVAERIGGTGRDTRGSHRELQLAARVLRDAMRDKSYRATPLGLEVGHFMRHKRKRLTPRSYNEYESCLCRFALHFADLTLADFEPPVGTERLEDFLDHCWGASAPRTYNKNLSALSQFFKFQALRQGVRGDPTLGIERAKKRDVFREVFSADQRDAILAANDDLRDSLACACCYPRTQEGRTAWRPVPALRQPAPPTHDLHEGREGAARPRPLARVLARP